MLWRGCCRDYHSGGSATARERRRVDCVLALPDCPRWNVIYGDNLPTLVDELKQVLVRQELGRPLLTQQGIQSLSIALSGGGLPQQCVVARALISEGAGGLLSERQVVILDTMQPLNWVEIRGCGKRQDLSPGRIGPSAFSEESAPGSSPSCHSNS